MMLWQPLAFRLPLRDMSRQSLRTFPSAVRMRLAAVDLEGFGPLAHHQG
jgi:hypothetical protein